MEIATLMLSKHFNTDMQISMSSNEWMLCFLYLCKLLLHRLKKSERVVFLSLFLLHPGEEVFFF